MRRSELSHRSRLLKCRTGRQVAPERPCRWSAASRVGRTCGALSSRLRARAATPAPSPDRGQRCFRDTGRIRGLKMISGGRSRGCSLEHSRLSWSMRARALCSISRNLIRRRRMRTPGTRSLFPDGSRCGAGRTSLRHRHDSGSSRRPLPIRVDLSRACRYHLSVIAAAGPSRQSRGDLRSPDRAWIFACEDPQG
jgi:hypothetical protein